MVYISLIVSCRKGKTHNGPGEERKHRLMGMVSILKSLLFYCLLFPFSHWVSFSNNCTQFCTAISQTYLHPLSYLLVYTHTLYSLFLFSLGSVGVFEKMPLILNKTTCFDLFKSKFSAAITAVFSATWSFKNHSNMLIWCTRKFLIINGENSQVFFYFSGFFE